MDAAQLTDEDFRTVGFTGMARDYPRDDLAIAMFAAFNGVVAEQLPEAFKFFPNEWTRDAWNRVADAAIAHIAPTLQPFADAAEQMIGMRPDRMIYGQPALGIGAIATVSDFIAARTLVEGLK